jgi:hypothetical protein
VWPTGTFLSGAEGPAAGELPLPPDEGPAGGPDGSRQ